MSGPQFLTDTNILIGMLADRPAAVRLIDSVGAGLSEMAASQITRIELLSFSELTPGPEAAIMTMLSRMEVICIDDAIEAEAITLRRRFRLKLADAIIGATARVRGLTLLTLDNGLSRAIASA